MIETIVATHVTAGALWTLTSLVVAVTRRASRALLALQTIFALLALLAGIALWHMLHAGPFGAREHWLVVGTLLAFVAMGLQFGIAVPVLLGTSEPRLAGGGLLLTRIGTAILLMAAMAMTGSMYV